MAHKGKTHKATSKRFKLTATGKVMHKRQGDNTHLKTRKNRGQKVRLNKQGELSNKKESNKVKRLMKR
jgi:large subunit ribosomal protein L35